jgi:hypothetical protein
MEARCGRTDQPLALPVAATHHTARPSNVFSTCKLPRHLRRGPPLHSQATKATRSQMRVSWTIKVSSRPSTFSRPSNSTRSEQEEVIQSLKVENDISDRQIWLCLRIVMGCFAFLSVPIGLYSSDPFKLQVQIRSISLSKGQPTQPVHLDKCSAPTHTPRYPIRIAPYHNPARPCSALPAR